MSDQEIKQIIHRLINKLPIRVTPFAIVLVEMLITSLLIISSSSSGMPQHWQISFLGLPSNVLIDTSKVMEICFRVSIFGVESPFSQRETAWRVTNNLSAISSCVRWCFVRIAFKISFVSSFSPSLFGTPSL